MEEADVPLYGGTLRVAYPHDPKTMCGLLQWQTQTASVLTNAYNRLLNVGEGFELAPDLAESWEVSSDGKQIVFHLAKNVFWHDGVPFTSADVKFHFELLKGWRSPTSAPLKKLNTIETPNEHTAIFRFSEFILPEEIFARGHADTFILPKHIFEGKKIEDVVANTKPIGTGPFKIVEYTPGSHVIFEAHEKYFRGRPYLDRVIYRIIPQPASALLAMESGQIDTINPGHFIPPQDFDRVKKGKGMELFLIQYYVPWRLIFNARPEAVSKHPWLRDSKVRTAFGHAINRDALASKVLFGVTNTTWGPISNLSKWVYNSNIPAAPKYDLSLAERMLDEAGYRRGTGGVRFKATLAVFKTQLADLSAEAIKAMLARIGVQVDLEMPELSTFQGTYLFNPQGLRDLPLCLMSGGPSGPDPSEMKHLYQTGGSMNCYGYSNGEADKLLKDAGMTNDKEKRSLLYKQFQQVVTKDLPAIWLYNAMKMEVASTEFRGFDRAMRPLEYWGDYSKVWWTKGRPR